ncbi:response regulator transcription factor [Solimicrobium silvestre]|uniref:Response regulators consisting of a CheY-like receiver domain and a winged-helix DNA-binding domain n=1 Tax=Solimicrobium silvestre TaxID=2099400 RepID=A0A2S9H1G1_9BURK|nr:Response regulators consisting of a CheY-like receiver domain and a winged-helix DNA-binding domain [Solimicrobium silvestre]
MFRVMLIEDDPKLALLVSDYLARYEFSVVVVERGDQALAQFNECEPDIVILDLMLPGLDGMVVCSQIRQVSKVPILILTAREDAFDEVSGLEQGADDYVNKPVQPRVLLARLRALLRRVQDNPTVADIDALGFGALHISKSNRTIHWRDQPVTLNSAEYKLFILLAESAGQVLSRNDILVKMRGIEFDGLNRSIDNIISRLRRKFDDADSEKIKTVRSEGYLFSPSAWN